MQHNYFYEERFFDSIDKKHQIRMIIIDDVAWFSIEKLEYEFYKTFLLMLKDIMEWMCSHNVKFVKQQICETDLGGFKMSSSVALGDGTFVISTPIIHFISELADALGIQRL